MNALELLKEDHQTVAELFEQFKENEDGDNVELFEQIKKELEVHTRVEEAIFYPKMRDEGNDELKQIVLEGIEEHRQVKKLIAEISELADDSEKFNPKLKVLVEDVEHHVEEEEDEMFPLVEAQFDEDTLEELGAAIEAEKQELTSSRSASAG